VNDIKLIVGLGNPGSQYENTRHNTGADFVTELANRNNVSLRQEAKYFGLTGRFMIDGQDVRLLIPTTFMNSSGQAVAALANFYRIKVEEILVAHDELDLPTGVAKIKKGGGHGGHNGLRDIMEKMGNNRNFYRLRIGIDHPGDKNKVAGYVLTKAPKKEFENIKAATDEAIRCIDIWYKDGLAIAQNRLHSFKAE